MKRNLWTCLCMVVLLAAASKIRAQDSGAAMVPAAQPAPLAAPAQPAGPERFQGTIVNQGGALARFFQAGFFTVEIERYSTDDETKVLLAALEAGGQKALLEKLWKMKQIGFLKVGGGIGYPLVVARSKPIPDGGRVIRVLTNRGIAPAEFYNMSRSTQYPFGYIEFFLPADGKGHGTLIPMGQVELTTSGQLTVESYGVMPVRLLDVVIEAPRKK